MKRPPAIRPADGRVVRGEILNYKSLSVSLGAPHGWLLGKAKELALKSPIEWQVRVDERSSCELRRLRAIHHCGQYIGSKIVYPQHAHESAEAHVAV